MVRGDAFQMGGELLGQAGRTRPPAELRRGVGPLFGVPELPGEDGFGVLGQGAPNRLATASARACP